MMPWTMRRRSVSRKKISTFKLEILRLTLSALFYGGFFMLPWLWLVNYLLFRKYFKRRSTPPEVKWYARTSLLLFFAAFLAIIIWVIIYQLRWRYWGEFGEKISLVIPIGD